MQVIFFLLVCGTMLGHHRVFSEKATAVQIVHIENHSIRVDSKVVRQILGNEHVKDRQVMVFSIAGPYRKGKSFFLNFPLKYLRAQYVKHDITDWIGESGTGDSSSNELNGFKWRGGQMPQTTGIWMWSEIFTHDYDNGDRVAIILLDTQGIFDHESSTIDYTATFAISMMLASVQCYNVMQNVQEDSLQNLDFFTQYGRLASGQSDKKPFQQLLFLVRDWPYADEMNYGYAPNYVEKIMAINNQQSSEMHELRDRIKSSFERIDAFLMPYPGTAVAEGKNANSDLRQMDPRFVRTVKEIVPSIFAPENLVVKYINGQKIRANDFVMYLEEYAKIFNRKTLPEPKTALMATAQANLLILHRDCLNLYVKKMQEVMGSHSLFYSISELEKHHENARKESLQQFQSKPKFNFPGLTSSYATQLDTDIAGQFSSFKQINEERVRLNEQRVKFEEKWEASDSSNLKSGWDEIKRVVIPGLSGGFCALMGWNPFVMATCAIAGAILSSD